MRRNQADEIYEFLSGEIREHRLPAGGMLPSESTLCRQFYVSRPTVRKAIARLIGEGAVHSEAGRGTFVTLREISVPENRSSSVPRPVIGIDGIDFHDEYQYYTRINSGARAAAEKSGVMLCLADLPELLADPEKKVDAFIATRIESADFDTARRLQERGIPMVLLNRRPPLPELSWLSVDFEAETFRVVDRLLRNGARNIALIGRQTSEVATAGRTRGWEAAFHSHQLPVPYHLAVDYRNYRENSRSLPEFFRKNPVEVAFVTAGYQLPPVLQALARLGMRPGREIDLICFDDVESFCENIDLPISYIRMPLRAMGTRAVEYLAARLQHPGLPRMEQLLRSSLVINDCKYLL